jgi:hypothetical protein
MGEHKLIMGKDIYFWNFIILMFFTLFEVGAVYVEGIGLYIVWAILIGVGIIKGFGIGAFFMHLWDDPKIYLRVALFPTLFVLLMLWGIGLSNPEGVNGLPGWCTPDWGEQYATER